MVGNARRADLHLSHAGASRGRRRAARPDARGRHDAPRSTRSAMSSAATPPQIRPRKTLIIASHYDTVRNAGKYDGRLGILTGAGGGRAPAPQRAAAAVPSRRDRVLGGGGRALLRALYRQQRDRRPLRPRAAAAPRRRRPERGRRHARRRASIPRPSRRWRAGRRICSAISRCISSRGRCCCRRTCRSASSRRSRATCALQRHDHRHGGACRHGADGAAARCRRRRRRDRALCGAALRRGADAGRHGRPARRAGRRDQRHSGPLRALARYPRRRRCDARRRGRRRARRDRAHRASGAT